MNRNDYKFEKDQVGFIHIPKTGGTSLHVLFKNHNFNLVNSNVHNLVSKYCPTEEYRYITVIRDPVERVWSYYQMAKRDRFNPSHMDTKKSLEKVILNNYHCSNTYIKMYSGDYYDYTYENAMKNLKNFYYVGMFENFSKIISDLNVLFKLNMKEINLRNVNYGQMNNKERELIIEHNKEDIEFYKEYRSWVYGNEK